MNIGEASKASKVSAKMIRCCEQIGLIAAAQRTASDHRAYGHADMHQLHFIRRTRDLGCSVAESGDLLNPWNPSRARAPTSSAWPSARCPIEHLEPDMPRITVLPHADLAPDGAVLEVPSGTSISEALLAHGIEIEHACDMSCACTTCHCIVREGFDSLDEARECEDDLAGPRLGLEAHSRLSCQAIVAGEDLTIEIPKYTVNHAKETR